MMMNPPNCDDAQLPMYEMDCNILQEISQSPRNGISADGSVVVAPKKKMTKNEAELLDMGWNAMASFDNEHCEMECLVQDFRQVQEKKASRGRWVLGLVLFLFFLIVGAMSFAIRPSHSAHGMDPSEKKRPAVVRSKNGDNPFYG